MRKELAIAKMKGKENFASFILRMEGLRKSLDNMGEQIAK